MCTNVKLMMTMRGRVAASTAHPAGAKLRSMSAEWGVL